MLIKRNLVVASFLSAACLPVHAERVEQTVNMGPCNSQAWSALYATLAENAVQGKDIVGFTDVTPKSFTLVRFDAPLGEVERTWLTENIADKQGREPEGTVSHYPDAKTGRTPLSVEELKPVHDKYHRPAVNMEGTYVTYICK